MATAAILHSKQKTSSGDGGVGRGWGEGSVGQAAVATVASIKRSTRATVASVKQRCGDGGVDQSGGAAKGRRCGVDQSGIATVASIKTE